MDQFQIENTYIRYFNINIHRKPPQSKNSIPNKKVKIAF